MKKSFSKKIIVSGIIGCLSICVFTAHKTGLFTIMGKRMDYVAEQERLYEDGKNAYLKSLREEGRREYQLALQGTRADLPSQEDAKKNNERLKKEIEKKDQQKEKEKEKKAQQKEDKDKKKSK